MRILISALLAGVLLLLSLGYLHVTGEVPATPTPELRTTYLEVMPESSGENPRVHHRGPDGIDRWVDLSFKNGETGKLTFGENGRLREAVYLYADGVPRKTMRFAADGVSIVEGFEHRHDRSLLWRTETSNANELVVTTVFWTDGKQPFSVIEENRAQNTRASKYFRPNGSLQLARTHNLDGVLLSEKAYNESGVVLSELSSKPGLTQVDYFRANGTLEFRQLYDAYELEQARPDGSSFATVSRILAQVLVIAEDGDTVLRQLTISGGYSPYVQQELKANEDGTRTRFVFNKEGQTITAKLLSKDNRQVNGFVEAKGTQHAFDPSYTQKPGAAGTTVVSEWKSEEAKASK